MFTTLLIATGLAAGQPLAAGDSGPVPTVQIEQPAPVNSNEEEKKDEPQPTKYLLERSLAETRLGEILSNRGITVYGWTGLSYNVSSASANNLPRGFDYRANQFLLNQHWLHIEKTLDTQKNEFQWGWVTDWIMPGSDYRFTLARGLWDDQLISNGGGPQVYGFDPVQFYLQAYLPNVGQGTTVKFGRFASHCEYEQNQQVDSPFVSRSYVYVFNPFTHTGAMATTQLNDNWSIGYGLATGADTFIDAPTNRLTYLGQIKWAPKDGNTSVILNTVITNPKFSAAENFNFYNVYNLQVIHKLTDRWTYIFDGAFSHEDDIPSIGSTSWYGAANYLTFQINDQWSTTLRAEVFNDTDGFRTGFEGLYTEVTWGVAWKPCPGLILRPSFRFDHNNQTAPFEGSPRLYTGTMECIIRW